MGTENDLSTRGISMNKNSHVSYLSITVKLINSNIELLMDLKESSYTNITQYYVKSDNYFFVINKRTLNVNKMVFRLDIPVPEKYNCARC